jgi:prolyl-tRNA synthetase
MRGREFIMKDAYSFDVDEKASDKSYWKMYEVYRRIFSRCGLRFRAVEADSGAIGGSYTHEFQVLAQSGEDRILSCSECDYAANVEQAECAQNPGSASDEKPAEQKEVETPDMKTIEDVSNFLKVPQEKIVKSLIYKTGDAFVMVCVRGDREANPVKIQRALATEMPLEMAEEDEILKVTGGPMGFSGPLGIGNMKILADMELKGLKNFTIGANKKDAHIINVNWDGITVTDWKDLRVAGTGETCPRCGKGKYEQFQGIEVGQVFKLGTKYSESMKALYLDDKGKEKEMVMGCYGIGVGRTVAAAIEQNHDDNGIIWPWNIAPFHIALLLLDTDNPETVSAADRLYQELQKAGYEVLYDDRNERPGFKFADADLLGFPIRITVGARGLKKGGVEITSRRLGRDGNEIVALDKVLEAVEKFKNL